MRSMKPRQPKLLTVLSWIVLIIFLAAAAYLAWHAVSLGIFSAVQLAAAGGILALVLVLFLFLLLKPLEHSWVKWVVMAVCLALSVVFFSGGYYMEQTGAFFASVSGGGDDSSGLSNENAAILNDADVLSNKVAMSVVTYAMHETDITKPGQLNGKTVGVIRAADEKGTDGALDQLRSKGATSPETVEYENAFTLVDALFAGNVDAIVLPEQFHEDLLNAANDFNQYNALTTFTNTVDQYIYYEPMPDEMKNPADPVRDITKDPFTVLISGADSYGNLSATSRSDVNMLVTVNPVSHQVLIVSLPRDTYIPFSCKKDETACINISGAEDKLTHSGIYGIGTTESTIEDFLDVEINYTVRVNFSSLINIIDAVDGIDVEVEPGLEVETFYANGTEGVKAGLNHLDGERALAFARERHAYLNGDNQRVINQQLVLKSLLKKMMSPTMVIKYPSFIRALSTAFVTNMPSSQIKALIGLEISSFPSWDIQSYALSGDTSTQYSPSLNAGSSVVLVDEAQAEHARELIDNVIGGSHVDADPSQSSTSGSSSSSHRSSRHSRTEESQDSDAADTPSYTAPGAFDEPESTDPGYYDEPYVPDYDYTPQEPVFNDPGFDQPDEPIHSQPSQEPDSTEPEPTVPSQPDYSEPDGTDQPDAFIPLDEQTDPGQAEGESSAEGLPD